MLLDALGEKVAQFEYQHLPKLAVETAKDGILDTIGVTLAGAGDRTTDVVGRTVLATAGEGPALVLGSRRRVDVLNAAMVNGTASHALDFDDCSNTMGGHPSAPIVPALWALAEARGATGREFLTAYGVGVEAETKLGRAVNFHHYEKGWHPTSTLGTFGAAAACARLIGLDAEATARALALAASMAAGIKANFGTMTKPFHVGQAARAGLLSALLAENGMEANRGALEHRQGFFEVYNGKGTYHPERLIGEWCNPVDLIEPGIAFKRHPCCASTHPAIDALLQIKSEHGLAPENVAHILSHTHPRRLSHTNRPNPTSGLDGKFSVQYVLARALRHGLVSITHFSNEAVFDRDTRALMERIVAEPDPAAIMETTEHFYARVRVTTTDGRQLEAFVDAPTGRDRDHPLPPGTLEAKFADCAGLALDPARVGELLARLKAIEDEPDIRALSDLMSNAARTTH